MNEQEQYMMKLQRALEESENQRVNAERHAQSMSGQITDDKDMASAQLDLREELDKIYHLLSGHVLEYDAEGNEFWTEPKDDRLKIFSDYGVKQIMNIIHFYINKNTLLSNYQEDVIKWKVRDFGIELSDLIFNRYEVFFSYPTPEDLFDIYKPIAKEQGLNLTDEELYEKCLRWSSEELQSKLRHFPLLILAVLDSVHSTYLRALGGKERQTLRERINITQNASQYQDTTFQEPRRSKWNAIKP